MTVVVTAIKNCASGFLRFLRTTPSNGRTKRSVRVSHHLTPSSSNVHSDVKLHHIIGFVRDEANPHYGSGKFAKTLDYGSVLSVPRCAPHAPSSWGTTHHGTPHNTPRPARSPTHQLLVTICVHELVRIFLSPESKREGSNTLLH